jgi:hypothetical protein
MKSIEGFVPEGHATIAQRFNVGNLAHERLSPEGMTDTCTDCAADAIFSRAFGTFFLSADGPNVETLGYYQASLRDSLRGISSDILVALPVLGRSDGFQAKACEQSNTSRVILQPKDGK